MPYEERGLILKLIQFKLETDVGKENQSTFDLSKNIWLMLRASGRGGGKAGPFVNQISLMSDLYPKTR